MTQRFPKTRDAATITVGTNELARNPLRGKAFVVLSDGTYDVIVVDVDSIDDALSLDVAIASGDHRGDVVTIRAQGLARDPLDVLGLPGTLSVRDGEPELRLDR